MCGIAGFWEMRPSGKSLEQPARAMINALRHRGPDGNGVWVDDSCGLALAHSRLAIVDLSPAGHQPMSSASGRYVLVFNGEIYNHLDLRARLEAGGTALAWRGHSDTETLLACIERYGLQGTLELSTGMFALALWDRQTRTLSLARDRFGEKPLYYGWQGNTLLFASELKALKAHPAFNASINRDAVALLMRHCYIPAPHSVYEDIHKLMPGTLVQWQADDLHSAGKCSSYWSLGNVIREGQAHPFRGSDDDAVNRLDQLLRDAVLRQMAADVPLGAFLSGGVDSSTIVALMQAQSSRPVKTFSIGFENALYNEADMAKAVARHLGTEHTEVYLTADMAIPLIDRLPAIFDEPFADSSQIPTFLVSQLARQHVTVSLSGDGGDELFGGYPRYQFANTVWSKYMLLPAGIRHALAGTLGALEADTWNRCLHPFQAGMPERLRHINIGQKLKKGSSIMHAANTHELYAKITRLWPDNPVIVPGATIPDTLLTSPPSFSVRNPALEMMALETLTFLPDVILCKVDRTSMAVSLESRAPLLDHSITEFAWSLPLNMKLRRGQGKWILREVLHRYVPPALVDRPKMGFATPISDWLRGPLRDWAEVLLDESRLRQEGFLDPAPIRQKWSEHLSGQGNWHYHLWTVLMFQSWLEKEKH